MRKRIVNPQILNPNAATPAAGEIDITELATAWVTSEDPAHPVENAFDRNKGAGASYWAASESGMQTIVLIFDRPQRIRTIQLEIEERDASRRQVLQILGSQDGGQHFDEVLRQEYNFSVSGATFQQENWTVDLEGITHLRLDITPDLETNVAPAKLTSLSLSS